MACIPPSKKQMAPYSALISQRYRINFVEWLFRLPLLKHDPAQAISGGGESRKNGSNDLFSFFFFFRFFFVLHNFCQYFSWLVVWIFGFDWGTADTVSLRFKVVKFLLMHRLFCCLCAHTKAHVGRVCDCVCVLDTIAPKKKEINGVGVVSGRPLEPVDSYNKTLYCTL